MSEEESFVCVCVSERESHSTVKDVPPVFSHGIRARLALERTLGFGVTILQVIFEGLLVAIWRCGATTAFFWKNVVVAPHL